MKTNYKIIQHGDYMAVIFNNYRQALCNSEEDALQSIWVATGSKYDDFYVVNKDGNVFKIDRGSL